MLFVRYVQHFLLLCILFGPQSNNSLHTPAYACTLACTHAHIDIGHLNYVHTCVHVIYAQPMHASKYSLACSFTRSLSHSFSDASQPFTHSIILSCYDHLSIRPCFLSLRRCSACSLISFFIYSSQS